MYETIKIHLTPLRRRYHRTFQAGRKVYPLQVKACEVDGYGNYGDQLAEEFQAAAPHLGATAPIADVSDEEFEAVYHWFWS